MQAGPPEWPERPQAGPWEVLVGPGVGTTAAAAAFQARDGGSPSWGSRGVGPDGPGSDPTAGCLLSNLRQQ